MDDFTVNFATGPAPAKSAASAAKKGGRWTDRVRDKRRSDGAVKKQSRPLPIVTADSPTTGKRPRDDSATSSPRISNSLPAAAPRLRPITTTSAAIGDLPALNKTVLGPGGKKQYISSLFTAEGLPAPSGPSAPVVPARPSNAPIRAPEPVVVEQEEEQSAGPEQDDKPIASTSSLVTPKVVKPSPAPALDALGLLPEIVSHLAGKMKITGPTACQAGAIPPLILGTLPLSTASSTQQRARDAILQAQTGSGKTLAFLLPIIQDLLTLPREIFGGEAPTRSIGTLALILAPTRELAAQIYSVLEAILSLPSSSGAETSFTVPPRALTPCLLVGGANRTHEKSRLRKGCPIVVATPGRLLDHLRTTESFRMAGEPIASKGPRGRGAGIPGTGANYGELGSRDKTGGIKGRALGLRWLVVDECDRLMDLGFEEQMRGVLEELERRSPNAGLTSEIGRRRTVLCSATASEGVDRLGDMALHNPVTLTASTSTSITVVVPKISASGEPIEDASSLPTEINFTPPTQLIHNYVVCPPKLRFVGLIALLRRVINSPQAKKGPGNKILVFLSCTDAVDFYWEAMGSMGMGHAAAVANTDHLLSAKEKSEKAAADAAAELKRYASNSPLLPGVPIYRLHGNLELATRLGSLSAFSKKSIVKGGKLEGMETENAVLLCTSVAARGLDVPFVGHVVNYDLPNEGGVTEYIHRVGRTARAGASGQATSFLLPSETEWVPWVETGMRSGAEKRGIKDVKLREVGVEDILKDGFGGSGREYETRATDVQMGFERWVSESTENGTAARNAFASSIKAYATHPAAEKAMFNTKSLHLGHLAKSFGMREAPGSSSTLKSKKGAKSVGRVSIQRPIGRVISAREAADRAIASLPARNSGERGEGFETGRRFDEDRAMKRQQEKVMKGPTGEGGGEFQIASSAMLESLAKSQNQANNASGGGKRKRAGY